MRCIASRDDGTTTSLTSLEELSGVLGTPGVSVWVDLLAPAEEELRAVGKLLHLDQESLQDCLSGEQRPRVDEFEDHIFLVLYGVVAAGSDDVAPRKLAVFCGRNFLVTAHEEPLRTTQSLFARHERNPGHVLKGGVDTLLHKIIDGLVDNLNLAVQGYEQRIEDLEEMSLETDVDERVLSESAALRRTLLPLRSLAVSTRELLLPIARGEFDYISDALEQRFSHVRDHLTQAVELIDSFREHLASVRENYHTAVATQANATMKALTVLATLMLPPTLIAGIYGMNVPVWPSADHPLSFWGVLALMAAVMITVALYARHRKWI